jgi:hypothetical protein
VSSFSSVLISFLIASVNCGAWWLHGIYCARGFLLLKYDNYSVVPAGHRLVDSWYFYAN